MYTILCVDNDKKMLGMLRRILRSDDYRVITAESGEEGLTVLKENPVQIVISDYKMPNMNGAEFLVIVRNEYPGVVRIMISGSSGVESRLANDTPGVVHKVITKPLDVKALRLAVELALIDSALGSAELDIVED